MGILMYNGNKIGHGSINTVYSGNIGTGATVVPEKLLYGEKAWNDSCELVTGTMPNNKNWVSTPKTGGIVAIPEGYHNGNGYVDTTAIYEAGIAEGSAIAITSTTLVDHIYDDTQKNYFFASGKSGTRWSWTNTLGNCKVFFYVELDKADWDGGWGIHVFRKKADGTRSQLFSHQEYSGYYHGYALNKGQSIEIDADDSNTRLKGCVIVLYSF